MNSTVTSCHGPIERLSRWDRALIGRLYAGAPSALNNAGLTAEVPSDRREPQQGTFKQRAGPFRSPDDLIGSRDDSADISRSPIVGCPTH
jgi:hypothetical protein